MKNQTPKADAVHLMLREVGHHWHFSEVRCVKRSNQIQSTALLGHHLPSNISPTLGVDDEGITKRRSGA